MEKMYLSVNEAVKYLQSLGLPIHKSSLYKMTMEKTIPFKRFGEHRIVFQADELKSWLENMLVDEGIEI